MQSWALHDAKNRLSQLIAEASGAAQVITVRGREAVVVISIDEYQRLTRRPTSLVTFLRESPLAEVTLDLERDQDSGRQIEL